MPEAKPTTFTPESAQRIAKAVRKIEQTPGSAGGRGPAAGGGEVVFWARLREWYYRVPDEPIESGLVDPAGSATLGYPRFYSFVRAEPDGQGGFVPAQPYAEYKAAARRLNDDDGQIAPCGSIVRMTFVGYDGLGQPLYVFAYDVAEESAYLRPHDHRDNFPWSGGFAFSVYHPGTAVPQQPWAI